jgi:hypothetical protein
MKNVVIDTNVLVAAEGAAPHAAQSCVLACIRFLKDLRNQTNVLVDDEERIMREYLANLRALPGQPRTGRLFYRWLRDSRAKPNVVKIHIDETASGEFPQFPDDPDLKTFDRSDRKFVAVALASELNPPVANATDSDWANHRSALIRCGVIVHELCECANQSASALH